MIPPRIVALRHPKEKRSKCSLKPIETLEGTFFRRAKPGFTYDGTGHVLLATDAPVISPADALLTEDEVRHFEEIGRTDLIGRDDAGHALRPVLLLDCAWRLLPGMRAQVTGTPVERSLPPSIRTAYPRVSKLAEDPEQGLATIEALYAALRLMGFDRPELLEGYRWLDDFLALNRSPFLVERMKRAATPKSDTETPQGA